MKKIHYLLFLFIGSILTAVISLWQLSNGTYMSPNSWAFWEWSTSLLCNNGYEYFGGQPGGPMPPGTSYALMFFQKTITPTAFSINLLITLTRALAFFSWFLLYIFLIKNSNLGQKKQFIFASLISVFLISILISSAFILEANLLQLVLVPPIFFFGIKISYAQRLTTYIKSCLVLVVIFFIQFYIHYSSVIFIPGIALTFLINKRFKLKFNILGSFLFVFSASISAIFVLKPYMINPASNDVTTISNLLSNPLEIVTLIGNGKYSAFELLKQASYGFGNFFLPFSIPSAVFYALFSSVIIVTLILLVVFITKSFSSSIYYLPINIILQTGTAFFALFFIHTTVHLYDEFNGARFFYFLIFGFCPSIILVFNQKNYQHYLSILFMVLLISMPIVRTIKYGINKLIPENKTYIFQKNILLPEYTLIEYDQKSLLIQPPDYKWINRNYSLKKEKE